MIQVCSVKVPDTFHIIGNEIYKKYLNAKNDTLDQRLVEEKSKRIFTYRETQDATNNVMTRNYARSISGGNLIRRKRYNLNNIYSNIFDVERLEFFEKSPDFCNRSRYTMGTVNRICKTKVTPKQKQQGIQGCRDLCCQGKAFRRVKVTVKTNCKFHYCCKVTCDEETRMIKQHYCL